MKTQTAFFDSLGIDRLAPLLTGILMVLMGCESSLLRQVDYYDSINDPEAAISMLEGYVRSNIQDHEGWFLLGKTYYQVGSYDLGTPALDRSMRLSSRYRSEIEYLKAFHLNTLFNDANAKLVESDFEAAADLYEKAVHVDSTSVPAYLALGQSRMDLEDYAGAKEALEAALSLKPESQEGMFNLAEAYLRTENERLAYYWASRLLEIEETALADAAREKLFYSLVAMGQDSLNSANEVYARVIRPSAGLMHNAAVINFNNENYDVAIPILERLFTPSSEREEEYGVLLGEAFYKTREYDNMAAVFDGVVRRHPANVDARKNLIIAYDLIGFEAEADSQRVFLKRQLSNPIMGN